ncbi:hypothetical protein O3M35_011933 [Rhynocoris fuscipes]|uniref:Uncharacterized protein n=1 Tax=Rhynocoris fuscipes TaxID=488301 RepID=A0AAW1D391_9HEMI
MGRFHLHVRTILNPKFQYSTANRLSVMQDMIIRTVPYIRTSAHTHRDVMPKIVKMG